MDIFKGLIAPSKLKFCIFGNIPNISDETVKRMSHGTHFFFTTSVSSFVFLQEGLAGPKKDTENDLEKCKKAQYNSKNQQGPIHGPSFVV